MRVSSPDRRGRGRAGARIGIGLALGAVLAAGVLLHGQSRPSSTGRTESSQGGGTARSAGSTRRAENVVQAVRRSWERRPAAFRERTSSCLHYLDEAEAFHREGEALFLKASRARSSAEQTPLVRQANEAIAERTRLIKEFWACTRRTSAGDEFHSQDPPRDRDKPPHDRPPPHDPIDPPPAETPPPERPTPPPDRPGSWLPPGFPFPPAEARPGPGPRPTSPRPPPVPVIVALGDSITAGYRLTAAEAWPEVLQRRLQTEGYRYHVTNAGVVGNTAADARARLGMALVPNTTILIVALGLNDAKQGRRITQIEGDLAGIIYVAQQRRISVLLCGFSAPPTSNGEYELDFEDMFDVLEARFHVARLEDMVSIVWGDPRRYTLDGFHPNALGAKFIARQVFQQLKPMLGPPSAAPSSSR